MRATPPRSGAPLRVRAFQFEGAKALPESLMRAQIDGVLQQELSWQGFFQPLGHGDRKVLADAARATNAMIPPTQRFVPEIYERVLQDLTAAYRDRGFLAAKLGPLKTREVGKSIDVVVPVYEGPQTFVHSVGFRDNAAFSAAAFS